MPRRGCGCCGCPSEQWDFSHDVYEPIDAIRFWDRVTDWTYWRQELTRVIEDGRQISTSGWSRSQTDTSTETTSGTDKRRVAGHVYADIDYERLSDNETATTEGNQTTLHRVIEYRVGEVRERSRLALMFDMTDVFAFGQQDRDGEPRIRDFVFHHQHSSYVPDGCSPVANNTIGTQANFFAQTDTLPETVEDFDSLSTSPGSTFLDQPLTNLTGAIPGSKPSVPFVMLLDYEAIGTGAGIGECAWVIRYRKNGTSLSVFSPYVREGWTSSWQNDWDRVGDAQYQSRFAVKPNHEYSFTEFGYEDGHGFWDVPVPLEENPYTDGAVKVEFVEIPADEEEEEYVVADQRFILSVKDELVDRVYTPSFFSPTVGWVPELNRYAYLGEIPAGADMRGRWTNGYDFENAVYGPPTGNLALDFLHMRKDDFFRSLGGPHNLGETGSIQSQAGEYILAIKEFVADHISAGYPIFYETVKGWHHWRIKSEGTWGEVRHYSSGLLPDRDQANERAWEEAIAGDNPEFDNIGQYPGWDGTLIWDSPDYFGQESHVGPVEDLANFIVRDETIELSTGERKVGLASEIYEWFPIYLKSPVAGNLHLRVTIESHAPKPNIVSMTGVSHKTDGKNSDCPSLPCDAVDPYIHPEFKVNSASFDGMTLCPVAETTREGCVSTIIHAFNQNPDHIGTITGGYHHWFTTLGGWEVQYQTVRDICFYEMTGASIDPDQETFYGSDVFQHRYLWFQGSTEVDGAPEDTFACRGLLGNNFDLLIPFTFGDWTDGAMNQGSVATAFYDVISSDADGVLAYELSTNYDPEEDFRTPAWTSAGAVEGGTFFALQGYQVANEFPLRAIVSVSELEPTEEEEEEGLEPGLKIELWATAYYLASLLNFTDDPLQDTVETAVLVRSVASLVSWDWLYSPSALVNDDSIYYAPQVTKPTPGADAPAVVANGDYIWPADEYYLLENNPDQPVTQYVWDPLSVDNICDGVGFGVSYSAVVETTKSRYLTEVNETNAGVVAVTAWDETWSKATVFEERHAQATRYWDLAFSTLTGETNWLSLGEVLYKFTKEIPRWASVDDIPTLSFNATGPYMDEPLDANANPRYRVTRIDSEVVQRDTEPGIKIPQSLPLPPAIETTVQRKRIDLESFAITIGPKPIARV